FPRPLPAVLLLPATLDAQAVGPTGIFGQYQQLVWQEQNGLPQNTILSLVTTRDGYLWIGTYEGAARFDGTRFTVLGPATTPEIGGQEITALLQDSAGSLWLGTHGGGLTRYSDGIFTRFSTREGLSSDYVLSLFEDRDRNLWIGTNGGGVNRLRGGRFTQYTIDQGLPANEVGAVTQDDRGRVWVGTAGGPRQLGGRGLTAIEDPHLARAHILALNRTHDGALWAGTLDTGLYRITDGRVRKFGPAEGLMSSRIEQVYVDSSERVWVGTGDQGLFRSANGGRF